jgi:hypothetical protein
MDVLILQVLEPLPMPAPQVNEMVTFHDREYRIGIVKDAGLVGFFQLTCYDPAKGS